MSIEHPRIQEPTSTHPDSIDRSAIPGGELGTENHEQVPRGDVPAAIEQRVSSADTQPLRPVPAAEVSVDNQGGTRRFVGSAPQTAQVVPTSEPDETTSSPRSRKGLWTRIGALGLAAAAAVTFWATRGSSEEAPKADNQGDDKASTQGSTPATAGAIAPESPVVISSEVQSAPTENLYIVDPAEAAFNPDTYFPAYAAAIGMKYGSPAAIDKYSEINTAVKSGSMEQGEGLTTMQTFLDEELGGNFLALATALYENPTMPAAQKEQLISKLAPYVFADSENDTLLKDSLKDFADELAAAPRGMKFIGFTMPGGNKGVDFRISVGIASTDPNVRFGLSLNRAGTDQALRFAGSSTATPDTTERHLALSSTSD